MGPTQAHLNQYLDLDSLIMLLICPRIADIAKYYFHEVLTHYNSHLNVLLMNALQNHSIPYVYICKFDNRSFICALDSDIYSSNIIAIG